MYDDKIDKERKIKEAYERNNIYKKETICLKPGAGSDYADRLLMEKLATVRRHAREGRLVDLCCGAGEHLFDLHDLSEDSLGIDFSENFIAHAAGNPRALTNMRFVVGNAKHLPIEADSVATLYCFSALYVIPGVDEVFAEIARVLQPGGRCILDLGNSRSLNQIVVRAYPEIPPTSMITVAEMLGGLDAAGLRIVEHRRFQFLPLWASKPRWLAPLLHPVWKSLLRRRIAGRMLDEWVSSAPILRAFAFRHLIVCEKPLTAGGISGDTGRTER